MKLNLLDRCISYISPKAGEQRAISRIKLERISRQRGYNGALKGGRLKNWSPSSTDADAELLRDLPALRNRARDLARNNPHATAAIDEVANSLIGTGIKVRFSHADATKEKKFQSAWNEWFDSKSCDFEGRLKLRGIQWLVARSWFESGEVLIRKRYTKKSKMPLQLQVLEGDHIAEFLEEGDKIRKGIEYDTHGRIVAYHLYKNHPGSMHTYGLKYETVRIPAEEIIHVLLIERPGQSRGIPRLHAVILKMNDLDEFEDAELVRQKVSSCFTAFVHDIGPESSDLGLEDEEVEVGEKVTPGQIEFLPDGKTVTFGNPNTKEGYKDYTQSNLKSIAAGARVTYEGMTGDYSNSNYSSSKMSRNKFNLSVKALRLLILCDIFMDEVVDEFKRLSEFAGVSNDGITHRYIAPRVEMIEPVKETNALISQVRSGFKSWENAVTELGEDPDDLLEQIAFDRERFNELGLVLDSDSNVVQINGKLHSLDESEPEDEESN